MKKILICLVLVSVVFLSFMASGQIIKEKRPDGVIIYKNLDLKEKIEALESKILELERRLKEMVQILIPTDLGIYTDENDPNVPGDIKIVRGSTLELDDCDSLTQWSVHSGTGVTIQLDNFANHEGTGCIRVKVPAGITAIIKATKGSGVWDLSTYKYLKVWLTQFTGGNPFNTSFAMYFGESVYNEQQNAALFVTGSSQWCSKVWDISGISAGSRDGVTLFAIAATNSSGGDAYFGIDRVYADMGFSEIKAYDDDRVSKLYPKFYPGTYTGDGSSPRTIIFPRKGIPAKIEVMRNGGTDLFIWVIGMTSGYCHEIGGTNAWINTGITGVGDGYFTIGSTINVDTAVYVYTVFFQD